MTVLRRTPRARSASRRARRRRIRGSDRGSESASSGRRFEPSGSTTAGRSGRPGPTAASFVIRISVPVREPHRARRGDPEVAPTRAVRSHREPVGTLLLGVPVPVQDETARQVPGGRRARAHEARTRVPRTRSPRPSTPAATQRAPIRRFRCLRDAERARTARDRPAVGRRWTPGRRSRARKSVTRPAAAGVDRHRLLHLGSQAPGQRLARRRRGAASRSRASCRGSPRPRRRTGPPGRRAPPPAPVAAGALGRPPRTPGRRRARSGNDASCPKGDPRQSLRLGRAAPERRDRQVRHDPPHPRARLVVGADPVPVTVGGQERLLGQVLGAPAGAGERVRETDHGRILPHVEVLERLRRRPRPPAPNVPARACSSRYVATRRAIFVLLGHSREGAGG